MKLFFLNIKTYIIIYFLGLITTLIYIASFKGFSIGELSYILFFNVIIFLIFLISEYIRNRKLYLFVNKNKQRIEDFNEYLGKSPIAEEIHKCLMNQYEFYNSKLQDSKNSYNEHLSFINQWVHQMKTPLSVLKLKNEKIKNGVFISIDEEIDKLSRGLNLAMYYARVDSFTKDFLIEKVNVKDIVTEAVNSEKQMFIRNGVYPKVNVDKNMFILTDKKWFMFVIEQIIINAIKYSKGIGKVVQISAVKKENVIIQIRDYGIGIPKKDIERIFEAFFTGENGRKYGESTGMGLYISKKICDSLNCNIYVNSVVKEGTTFSISIKEQ